MHHDVDKQIYPQHFNLDVKHEKYVIGSRVEDNVIIIDKYMYIKILVKKKRRTKNYLYKCSEGTNSQVYVLKKYYIRVHNKFEYVTNFLHETIRMYPLFFLGI